MSRTPAWLILVAALTLTGCGAETAGGSDTPGGSVSGDWTLVAATVGGEPLVGSADRAVTLTIEGDQATGNSGCNSYFGTVEIDGANVRFRGLGGTEMACEPTVMALEQAYLAALGKVREAANDGDRLVLTSDGVELRFDPVQPTEPAALIGTSWVLEATIGVGGPGGSASSPVGEPATLELTEDGAFAGSTGCNMFSATYVIDGKTIELTNFEQTLRACDGDVGDQERAMIAVLTQSLSFSIDGNMLTITAPDGSALVYRVSDDQPTGDDPAETGVTGWWLLREGTSDGEPIEVGDHRVRLGLTEDQLSATAGCNLISAQISIDELSITSTSTDGYITTDMFCEELADLERAYIAALALPLSYELTGNTLEVSGDHGDLTFERAPAIGSADLVGRTWVLDSLLDPSGSSTAAVGGGELIFADDGTYTGTAGTCGYFGQYVIEGDQVTFTASTIDETACPDDTDAVASRIFEAQGSSFVPVIDGDSMTIIGRDGAGIVYVVEHPTV